MSYTLRSTARVPLRGLRDYDAARRRGGLEERPPAAPPSRPRRAPSGASASTSSTAAVRGASPAAMAAVAAAPPRRGGPPLVLGASSTAADGSAVPPTLSEWDPVPTRGAAAVATAYAARRDAATSSLPSGRLSTPQLQQRVRDLLASTLSRTRDPAGVSAVALYSLAAAPRSEAAPSPSDGAADTSGGGGGVRAAAVAVQRALQFDGREDAVADAAMASAVRSLRDALADVDAQLSPPLGQQQQQPAMARRRVPSPPRVERWAGVSDDCDDFGRCMPTPTLQLPSSLSSPTFRAAATEGADDGGDVGADLAALPQTTLGDARAPSRTPRGNRCSVPQAPYQRVAVRRVTVDCRWQHGMLLHYRAGSGKSIIAHAILYNLGPPPPGQRHVVLVPAAIASTYEVNLDARNGEDLFKIFPDPRSEEVRRYWRGVEVVSYEALEARLRGDDGSYARLREAWRGVACVADEAHYLLRLLRDPGTEPRLRQLVADLSKLTLMTGTPLLRAQSDLGALVSLVEDVPPDAPPVPSDAQGFRAMFYRPRPGVARTGYALGLAPPALSMVSGALIAELVRRPVWRDVLSDPGGSGADAAGYALTALAQTVALGYVGSLFSTWTKELDALEPNEAAIRDRLGRYTLYYDYDAPRRDGSADQRPYFPRATVVAARGEDGAQPWLQLVAPNLKRDVRVEPRVTYTRYQMALLLRYCAAAVTDPREQEALGLGSTRVSVASGPNQVDPIAFTRLACAISSLSERGVADVELEWDAGRTAWRGRPRRGAPTPDTPSAIADALECPKFRALADLLETLASCEGGPSGVPRGGGAGWERGGAYVKLPPEEAARAQNDIARDARGERLWDARSRFLPLVYSGFDGLGGGGGFSAYLTARGLPHIFLRARDLREAPRVMARCKAAYPLRAVPPHLEAAFYTPLDDLGGGEDVRPSEAAAAAEALRAARAATAGDPLCVILESSLMEGLSFTDAPLIATLEPLSGAGVQDQVRARVLRRFASPDPSDAARVVKVVFAMSAGYGSGWLEWARANADYLAAGAADWYAREFFTLPFLNNRARFVHDSAAPEDVMIREVAAQNRVVRTLSDVLSAADEPLLSAYCERPGAPSACAVCERGECGCDYARVTPPRLPQGGGPQPPSRALVRECRAAPFSGDRTVDLTVDAAWRDGAVAAWRAGAAAKAATAGVPRVNR